MSARSARDEETELAFGVEQAEEELIVTLLQSPSARRALVAIARKVERRREGMKWLLRGIARDRADAKRIRALVSSLAAIQDPEGELPLAEDVVALRLHRRVMDALAASVPATAPEHGAIRAARERADAARGRLVTRSLPIAQAVARKYRCRGVEVEDLVQEATIGLMRAVDRFDPRRGFRFRAYGAWWARQQVQRALVEHVRTIRVPLHVVQAAQSVRGARRVFRTKHGREPSCDELLATKRVDARMIASAADAVEEPLQLHGAVSGARELIDVVFDPSAPDLEDAVASAQLEREVTRRIELLPRQQQEILRLRFGIGGAREHTLQEVADRLGVSRERARRIEATALARINSAPGGSALASFLAP